MANISKQMIPSFGRPETNKTGGGFKADVTMATLTSADTFTYESESEQFLFLKNPTGGGITVTLDGQDSTKTTFNGYGTRSTTSGYAISVAAGEEYLVPLDTIKGFLNGVVDVTGGAGLQAALLSYK